MENAPYVKNQYRGINAHLHSYWQNHAGWNEFHTNHIADLTRLMRAQLYPMGYTAHTEQSLQIRRIGRRLKTRFHHKAVGVYPVESSQENTRPVIWLELLCPSNKPGGQDYVVYQERRGQLLESGSGIIELDYLHETPSTVFYALPNYSVKGILASTEPGASAYRIVVFNPYPSYGEGNVAVWNIKVDESVPTLAIPLGKRDVILDFGAAYRKTFEEMLYANQVDYRTFPVHFERYSEADQARIASRMLSVVEAIQAGIDLEANVPLSSELLSLDEALSRLEILGVQLKSG
jgi:hypothetical protein